MMAPSSSAPASIHQPDDIRSIWQNFHAAGAGRRHKSADARHKTYNMNHACLLVIDGKVSIQTLDNLTKLEYLGICEKINNTDFNYPEFGVIEPKLP
ncbi:MAG: hypothetical protein U5L09_10360 [Bacteroidales bacterium]|nr:hypothetical protein [Bacteroidales bacterium]